MGRRIVAVFELLLMVSLFALFAALIITTNTNDAIIESTESFVELVRYKGCITEDMYNDFLGEFSTPVDIKFIVTRHNEIDDIDTLQFTGDVLEAIENPDDDVANGILAHTYTMNVGDELQVVVRKMSSNFFDSMVGMLTGQGASSETPAIAIKGGMILNTQYQDI